MLKLLCTAEFDDNWEKEIARQVEIERVGFSLDLDPASRMNAADITKALQGKDIFICGYEKITRDVLLACPDLKLILSVRDGPEENIDVAACTELGIPVLFSGGRCERSVPEFTVTVMLLMAKPVIQSNRIFRDEHWTAANDLKLRRICEASTEIAGKTVGIIGLGRNGKGLARRIAAFDVCLIAYDPYVSEEEAAQLGVRLCSKDDLMRSSDFVVVLARVTEETKGMVDAQAIALMKPGACLINTARAALVDNAAMIQALQTGRIRAALDVFSPEPPPADSPLYGIPPENLLLTPHLAGLSVERVVYQSQKMHDILIGYLQGNLPATISNRSVLSTDEYRKRGALVLGVLS